MGQGGSKIFAMFSLEALRAARQDPIESLRYE
jgi:hypothetical protein